MPSSISNSSAGDAERVRAGWAADRAPAGPWGRTWLANLLLALAALAVAESVFRARGHRPSVFDDRDLWAASRAQASAAGPNGLVLLGTSRIQLGLDTTELRDWFPEKQVIQLAVDGRYPLAALEDLAEDERFCGTVICELTPFALEPGQWNGQRDYVDRYRRGLTLEARLNLCLRRWLERNFVVANPQNPRQLVTRDDRSRLLDYRLVEIERRRQRRLEAAAQRYRREPPSQPDVWLAGTRKVEPLVEKIQSRGGRVIFVRFPLTGELRELDARYYPRSQYWDRFAAQTAAATIHFEDHARLAGFECPDMSHLDAHDAPRFTRALCGILAASHLPAPERNQPPRFAGEPRGRD